MPNVNLQQAETLCARLTGGGVGAVAVVGVRGPAAAKIVDRHFHAASDAEWSAGQIRFGHWGGESVVLTPLADEHFEVHCHGGRAAIAAILNDLVHAGAKPVDAFEFELSGPALIAEARAVLSRCLTDRTAAIALDQVRGALLHWAAKWKKTSDAQFEREVESILSTAELTTRLDEPFRVVIAGPPNVGKSSLVNAIAGYERSITFDQPGTTRDVLHAETVIAGLPIRLSDTAGVRVSDDAIEREGVRRARLEAGDADLVIALGDPLVAPPVDPSWNRVIAVTNKSDAVPVGQRREGIWVSARSGEGLEDLLTTVVSRFEDGLPRPGQPAVVNRRQRECLEQRSVEGLRGLVRGTGTVHESSKSHE